MNKLTEGEFRSQVGEYGFREVVQLAEWLMTTDLDDTQDREFVCRYAPSIITRGESEVFGLSDPRFAIRLYLESEDGEGEMSVLNLRRIERMRGANPDWGKRSKRMRTFSKHKLEELPTPKRRPRDLLARASRIGDCLLQLPKRHRLDSDSWRVLQVDLGREYGETLEEGKFLGTPYLKHIPLTGGGLCAQANCFMATALLYPYAKGIHGLLEVTALAQRDFLRRAEKEGYQIYEMPISGLDYGEMTNYFHEVGLRVIKQVPKTMGYADPNADWTNRNDSFTAAAKAYIRSGMPVVLTVDLGRLAAPSDPVKQVKGGLRHSVNRPIYERNGWIHPEFEEISKGQFLQRRDHAVLLVGYKDEPGSEEFLVNDSASLPFLRATTGQLAEAGYYASEWSEWYHERRDDFDHLRSLSSLPVTPEAVKLPLLWWLPESEVDDEDLLQAPVEHWRDGLFAIVPVLFSGAISLGRNRLPFIRKEERYRDFRLVRLDDLVAACAEFLQGHANLPDVSAIRQVLVERFEWKRTHWAWVQFVRDPISIWIYDAELALPAQENEQTADSRRGFLRVGVWREEEEWRQVVTPRPRQNGDVELPPVFPDEGFPSNRPKAEEVSVAVNSSISVLGFDDATRLLKEKVREVVVYAFMRQDVVRLSDGTASQPAIEWMAAHFQNPEAIDAAAQKLENAAEEAGLSIKELAAYLPEIATPHEREATVSKNALRFLTQLSARLLAKDTSQTISISAGNRIQGIWLGNLTKAGSTGPAYVANIMSRETLGTTVLRRLAEVVQAAGEDSSVRFALRLESGELHLLNDWDALAWFALEMEREEWVRNLANRVGFSLDVVPWAFHAGIRPDQLAAKDGIGSLVRKRIFTAQLSDQGKGQFGTLPVGTIHPQAEFQVWLDMIREFCAEERPPGCEFSGSLTLEMEGCRWENGIDLALETSQEWLLPE